MFMGSNLKICMIAYTLYSTDWRVQREAEALAASSGKDVLVLSLREGDKARTYWRNGVEIQELGVGKYRGFSKVQYLFSYIKFMALAFYQCNRLLLKKKLDIVHIHNMPNTLIFAGIIPYFCGKKMVLDEHDTMPETYMAKFGNNSRKTILKSVLEIEESICCRMADKVICVNHVQEEALVKRNIPKKKMHVHMNLPDPKGVNYGNAKKESPDTEGVFKLCYHGTITNRLGIDLAVRAVKMVEGKIPRLEFHIFGGGDGKDECVAVSEALGLQKRVNFRGSVQFKALIPIIAEMDLGIIPNRKNEATELMLPVKMLEYVALGIPVVCPRSRAISYYFSEDMVFYYDLENIESMGDAIVLAYENRKLGMEKAENARKFFDVYGWDNQNKDLVDMYNSMAISIKN